MKVVLGWVSAALLLAAVSCASGDPEAAAPSPTPSATPVEKRLVPRSTSTSTTSTTSEAPESTDRPEASTVADIDFKNREYRVDCLRPVDAELVEGEWQAVPGKPEEGTVTHTETLFFDLTGDEEDEAIVALHCGVGAGTSIPNVFVFQMRPSGKLKQLTAERIFGYEPKSAESGLQVEVPVYGPEDPRCCATFRETQVWEYEDGDMAMTASTTQRADAEEGAPLDPPQVTVECPLINSIVYGTTERVSYSPGVTTGSAPITHWRMEYGDGGSYESESYEDATENLYWHDYSEPGQYVATLRATDSNGLSAEASCEVNLVYAEGAAISPPEPPRDPWEDYEFVSYQGRDYVCSLDWIRFDGYHCVTYFEGMEPPYIAASNWDVYCRINPLIWALGGARCSPYGPQDLYP